ncbi:MAG TPA: EAL domain-containing protein [Candidatus Nitrosocosmicus sp.]|nr:EAL domain-containing protein [Candidatus Nitrosocosmicus sp.]
MEQKISQSTNLITESILNSISDAIFTIDKNWDFLFINKKAEQFMNRKCDELIGKNLLREFPQFEKTIFYKKYKEAFSTKKSITFTEYHDPHKAWYQVSAHPVDETLTVFYRDVTKSIKDHEQTSFQASVLNQVRNAIFATDKKNRIIYWNDYAEKLYQWTSTEVVNKDLTDLIIPSINKAITDQIFKSVIKKGEWEGELEVVKKNGTSFISFLELSSLKDNQGKIIGTVGISTDVTKRKKIEEEIRYLASHDPLTQLPNRTLLREGFEEAMQAARLNGKMMAVLFVDLDRFKFINDTLGHILGDKLLKDIANRMKRSMRPEDIIARIGGDEFMVLLRDVSDINEVTQVASRLLQVFEPVFHLDNHEIHITASIGISLYPHDGEDVQSLLKNADTAMYRAKEQGKNSYELYSPILNERAMEKLMLQNSLQNALLRNELVIYYQPILDIKTQKVVGVESLLRWRHPQLGMIAPSDFIPLAEETGVIIPITQWILKESCLQNKRWHEAGFKDLYVAVNLSSQHFNKKNWDKMILDALKETNLDPHYLELEINENSIMKNTPQTIKMLNALRSQGLRFSIDDFGTGYSSLSYLTQFPIDGLKIDQSFMRFITTDSDDAAIITAIVYMAHNLNLKVVAEGIEAPDQFKFMTSIECDLAQGYLFSRPLPTAEVTAFIQKNLAE